MSDHHLYMQRCLDLAALGLGSVSPNPLVGSLIVKDGRIVVEGYHRACGGPHAEVNAINAVKDQALLKDATLYVNLEPCTHYGKTPPCADLIVSMGIPRVVIGTHDPYPAVSGSGIRRLREANIEVITGVLEDRCRWLNRRFFRVHEDGRPYIILKWAQSADGWLSPEDYAASEREKYWITGKPAVQLVHKWRSEEDAILVGRNTVERDDPSLTVRSWPGRNPVRIVLDPDASLTPGRKIFSEDAQTFVYTRRAASQPSPTHYIIIDTEDFLAGVMKDLLKKGINSVLVEGGYLTLQHFLERHLWDEIRVFTGVRKFGTGTPAPCPPNIPSQSMKTGTDLLEIFFNPAPSGTDTTQ